MFPGPDFNCALTQSKAGPNTTEQVTASLFGHYNARTAVVVKNGLRQQLPVYPAFGQWLI